MGKNRLDVVIHLGKSDMDFLDLRYALRSIEKNVRNVRNVVIVGETPSWIDNVIHIGCGDDIDPKLKERNIFRKIKTACISRDVSENFLSSNDDIFILKEIDAASYPYYYKGTWYDAWVNNHSKYRATANHTKKWLEQRGFDDKNFDTHCPIIYNKKKFLQSFNSVDFNTPYGYGIKSIYSAVNRVEPVFMKDCKLKKQHTLSEVMDICHDRHVVSCTDTPMKYGLGEYLKELFPNKSRFEAW